MSATAITPPLDAVDTRVTESYNLYALRETNLESVRKAIAFKNPDLDRQAVDIQAELFITEAFHRAADESLKWHRRIWTGITLIDGVGVLASGVMAILSIPESNLNRELLIGLSALGLSAYAVAGTYAIARIVEISEASKWIRRQGNMEDGYSLNENAYGNKGTYKGAQRTIDRFVASAMKNVDAPAPAG